MLTFSSSDPNNLVRTQFNFYFFMKPNLFSSNGLLLLCLLSSRILKVGITLWYYVNVSYGMVSVIKHIFLKSSNCQFSSLLIVLLGANQVFITLSLNEWTSLPLGFWSWFISSWNLFWESGKSILFTARSAGFPWSSSLYNSNSFK